MRLISGLMHNILLTLLLESYISRENHPEIVKKGDLKGDTL